MRALPLLLVFALGLGAAFLVSCGGDRSKLIPASDAQQIKDRVDAVEAAVANGTASCGQADDAAAQARQVVIDFPKSVDPRLRDRLLRGIARLRTQAGVECRQQTGTQTTEVPTVSTQVETTTAPAETTTQPPDTTTQPPDTTTEPPATTQPPATTTPGGGTGGTGGATPGGATPSGGDAGATP
jgi:hypothetical protein